MNLDELDAMTEHTVSVDYRDVGRRTFTWRAVCTCGWRTGLRATAADAWESALVHSDAQTS